MTSGRKAYADLGRQIETLRADAAQISRRLGELTLRQEQAKAQENREVARLAQLRLHDLDARRVGDALGAADREAMALMTRREAALAKVEAAIQVSAQRQQALEAQRDRSDDERESLQAQIASGLAGVIERARASEAWQALATRAETLESQADHAAEKAAQAEGDRAAKGAPYEADPLFSYLWQRQYGSATYRAGLLARALDGWVARLIGYRDAARNYRLLLALPAHLRRHADALAAEAGKARADLEQFERVALDEAGIGALQDKLAQAGEALDATTKQIAAEEAAHAQLLRQRGEFVEGRDEYTRNALALLNQAIAGASSEALDRATGSTPDPRDDAAAAAIAQAREAQHGLDEQIRQCRREHDERLSALARVEELRRRFREERYDGRDSDFDDGLDWDNVVGGVMRGVLEMTRAWERVQRHQKFRMPRSIDIPGVGDIFDIADIFGGGGRRSGSDRKRGRKDSRKGGFGGNIFKGGGGFGGGGGFRSGGGF
jgi:hypothetical protein